MIEGYGKIHYLSDAAYRPQPDKTYNVVFALSLGTKAPTDVNDPLEHVARAVNLYAAAGVPRNHVMFVAVAFGAATPLVLNDAQYRAAYGMPNLNLELIKMLRASGVDVSVCGQAVAEHKHQYEWVDKSVTLTSSALTTITTLENAGYGLVPL
jgi:intracellular sulfur oxidation DsrE/DsrF family protein